MTKSKLLAAICGIAISGGVSAAGVYDSNDYPGDQPTESHLLSHASDGICAGFCLLTSPDGDGWQTTLWNFTNPSPGVYDVSGNITSANTSDLWVCDVAGFTDSVGSRDASGNCAGGGIGAGISYVRGDGVGTETPNSPVDVVKFKIYTNEEGKMTDAWWVAQIDFGGLFFTTYQSINSGADCAFAGGDADLVVAAIDGDVIDAAAVEGDASLGCSSVSLPTGASLVATTASGSKYGTCDIRTECGQFGKSVPVPAFAAGALGLGLLGVTYLTGRRRQVK